MNKKRTYWIKHYQDYQSRGLLSVAAAPSVTDQSQHLKVTIGHSTIEVPKGASLQTSRKK